MAKLLQLEITPVRDLPEETQDLAADALFMMIEHANDHDRTSCAVIKAAAIMDVPVFVLSRNAQEQDVAPITGVRGTSHHRQFAFEENGSPWSHRTFVDALTAEDRSILILAGFWLEHQ